MAKNVKDFYLLEVGGTPWLVPIDKAGSYSLRIRLFGIPWAHADRWMSERDNSRELLLEIPATKLDIRKP
jgi:hypothetical protein